MLFKNYIKNLKSYLYETGYDLWLTFGVKYFYVDVLFETQEFIRWELVFNKRKVRKRKDFITLRDRTENVISDRTRDFEIE
tara:strand:- start:184 stop:426 length:243 start_codon:yes stop_codon:yes gene_type:complete